MKTVSVDDVDEMRKYCLEHLLDGYGFKAKEIGPYQDLIRFDVLGINRLKREIRILEIKSGRADFISDHKWQSYLPYCTHFAFVAPKNAIQPDELPAGIGLVEFWYEERTGWRGDPFYLLDHRYVRGCSRLQERPDDEHYIDLLEGVVMRQMTQNNGLRMLTKIQGEIQETRQDIGAIMRRLEGRGARDALPQTKSPPGR
jgi:hypothetical protein